MAIKFTLIVCLLLVELCIAEVRNHALPPYLKVCKRSDTHLEKCVASALETLRPYLEKGIPEVGVPPCEPLIIPEVIVTQGRGPISLTTNYTNIHVYGPSQFQLKTVRVDLDHDILLVRMKLPSLHLVSNYTISGRFLMLPINGRGISHSNYSDIDVTASIQSERFVKNGETFFNVHDFFMHFEIKEAEIVLEDTVLGKTEIGVALNRFLNENWRSFADEFQPTLEHSVGDLFKEIANNIFHKFPVDTLLPP